ncbi:MAG: 23S rRNA (adenine(2503)-C(2))-methyltransferase RlmN [Parachlamydiales bacterium]
MKFLCDYTIDELAKELAEMGEASFIAKQMVDWVYLKSVSGWDQMSNLSAARRQSFSEIWRYSALKLVKVQPSDDQQTYKFLWELYNKQLVESVLIFSDERRTVCVSSQVGCPAACAFCASGKQGFKRNLAAAEIVEQVVQINHWLAARGEKITHVVYMGMGEPMKNYNSVVRSINILCHPQMLNLSQRRITVSTVGVIEGIKQLSHEGLKVNLVLSLHAPNQHIRKKIIPYARKYPLEDILTAMDDYATATKRDITYEYTLIHGINDHPDHAFELANLLRKRQCTVNLIPYNPVEGVRLKRPDKKAIKEFRSVLFGAGIVNTCRYTKGDDIAAACGQLALQERETSKSALPVVNAVE